MFIIYKEKKYEWAAKPKNDDRICISDYKMAYDEEHDTWYPNIGRISNIFGLTFEDGLLMIDADYVLWKKRRGNEDNN